MFIYEIQEQKKGSSVAERGHQLDQSGSLRRVETLRNVLLDGADGVEPGCVPLEAEWGEPGADRSPVLAAAPALHEPVGLQSVDELGDVRPHALQTSGKVPQGQ